MAKIRVKRSGKLERELELTQDRITVGRDAESDLVLLDPSVSRRHARIERTGDDYRIVDLGSGNGVVHQGKRVPEISLQAGLEVEIGDYVLELTGEESERRAKLVLIGGGRRRAHPVHRGETLVGRSDDAAITIDEPLVSSSHFKIVERGDVYALIDLGSQNGTYVNGTRVRERELKQGDQIHVGGLTFFFAADGVEPQPGSVQIIQPAVSASPAKREPKPAPEAAGSSAAPSAGPSRAAGKLASMPRAALAGAVVFGLFFFLLLVLLLRSPEEDAQREFQEVFQANLSEEERERIEEYLGEARDYEERGNLELALEQYRKILVLDETHQQARGEAARVEELLEAQAEERARREREERERLEEVAELTENADSLIGERSFEEARALLSEALSLMPDSEVLTGKMVASWVAEADYLSRRNTSQARAAYRKALELDPDNEEAKRGLGRIDARRRAARRERQQVEELTEAGLAQLRREEFAEAYASFSEVLKLDPGNARAREFRDQARERLDERLRPLYQEGVRLYNAGELAAAMSHFNRVLEQDPEHADTRAFLGNVMERVRAEAVDRYKRAYIYEGLGQFRQALELYRETLALLPDPSEEYHQKASERIAELNRKLQ